MPRPPSGQRRSARIPQTGPTMPRLLSADWGNDAAPISRPAPFRPYPANGLHVIIIFYLGKHFKSFVWYN
jgi:hypothetical protein